MGSSGSLPPPTEGRKEIQGHPWGLYVPSDRQEGGTRRPRGPAELGAASLESALDVCGAEGAEAGVGRAGPGGRRQRSQCSGACARPAGRQLRAGRRQAAATAGPWAGGKPCRGGRR
uniref:Uncharacterized protein n=1 Tax=Rangifer tarandus platyrhynchus TaxID=3082113 RepID=A0ACB0FBZ2_RANTA|nr:unnamed protein product [Rangifer tarandus platyrhynchus]